MNKIDEAGAKKIAEDFARKIFSLESVQNTSGLTCYGITNFSDYHVFWLSSGQHMVGGGSYIAVSKVDGSAQVFKCGE